MESMKLGRFRLMHEIARGGMGVVWLAEEVESKRRVVVKELLPCLRGDDGMRAMFLDEARLASRLAHANIVRTIAVGGIDDARERPYMALELLEGATLARVVATLSQSGKRMPVALGVRVLAAVLAALHHAHELRDERGAALGVVHRDVSPNNVFLTSDGRVKLLDFGVAKTRDTRRATETRNGVLKGSVAYMSPDHVCGATIDRRADVFAVGVLLRELLTGTRLWSDDTTEIGILKRLVARDIPVFAPRPGLPEELRAICKKAMAAQRSERFESADAMREALVSWLDAHDVGGSLGELQPVIERVMRDENKRRHVALAPTTPAATHLELSSSALVSVSDVVALPVTAKRDARRGKPRNVSGWLAALALAAGIVGVGVVGIGPGDVATALAHATAPATRPSHVTATSHVNTAPPVDPWQALATSAPVDPTANEAPVEAPLEAPPTKLEATPDATPANDSDGLAKSRHALPGESETDQAK